MNLVLLAKWVVRLVNQGEDLTSRVIRDSHNQWMDWEGQAWPVQKALAFWQGIQKTITILRPCFSARLGDRSDFHFWLNAWFNQSHFWLGFPLRD